MPKLIDKLPPAVGNRLRTRFGKQFGRFAMVAVVSLGASEAALFVFTELLHLTYGASGVLAAVAGAIVSYVLSRWAWQRKGRPDVLRETLPFWLVSAGAWIVLGLATKLGHYIATALGLHGFKDYIVVGGVYFLANCLTFLGRFLIFHYVLFADRAARSGPPESETLFPIGAAVSGSEDNRDDS
jgi:putative flippase GtrA